MRTHQKFPLWPRRGPLATTESYNKYDFLISNLCIYGGLWAYAAFSLKQTTCKALGSETYLCLMTVDHLFDFAMIDSYAELLAAIFVHGICSLLLVAVIFVACCNRFKERDAKVSPRVQAVTQGKGNVRV